MESSFSYLFSDLYKEILSYQGQDRATVDAAILEKAKRRCNDAYRKFLCLDWQFLSKHDTILLEAGKYTYLLPDDYANLRVSFKLFPYMGWANPSEVPMERFWSYQSFYPRTGIPCYFSFHTEYTEKKGLRYTVLFYPTPHINLSYNYEYKLLPNILVSDTDIPYCPPNLAHVLRAFCLAEVEQFDEEGKTVTHTNNLYNILLPQAIKENSIRSPNTVGNMNGDGSQNMNWPTIHPPFGNTLSVGGGTPYPA